MGNKLIFDFGAHYGEFSEQFSDSDTTIIMVDANPKAIEILEEKYKDRENVIIHHALLSTENDEILDFYICEQYDLVCTASEYWKSNVFGWCGYYLTLELKTKNLDYFVNKYGKPDFIKLDLEGYENEVIKGLSMKVGEMTFELLTTPIMCEKAKDSANHLRSLGYTEFGISTDSYQDKPDSYYDYEGFIQWLNDRILSNSPSTNMIWTK